MGQRPNETLLEGDRVLSIQLSFMLTLLLKGAALDKVRDAVEQATHASVS